MPRYLIQARLLAQVPQPHEDGPSYHPVVATLSLGTHTVMHYYRYASPSDEAPGGRAIDSTPILSLLLEPRSLVITTSALYTEHLHGIDAIEEDNFGKAGIQIANAGMLTGAKESEVVKHGETLRRETRYSLTCRDVSRVVNIGPGKAFGKR